MKPVKKSTFALYFGNRGFFPASHQSTARKEITSVLKALGHKTIAMPIKATRYGAIETPAEGKMYANFLAENRGKFDGVILCLPNFGDETGAIAALNDCGVPILIQAYPDEMDKMSPELRRDAYCGKFSVMDVFYQYGLKFTALQPHVVAPSSKTFEENITYFDQLCRVVSGMKNMVVGAVGARTTAFKTVRIDETALQRHGITMETLDLSDIFARVKSMGNTPELKAKKEMLAEYANWTGAPDESMMTICKLGVVIDEVIAEYEMDCLSIRCWIEMQKHLHISPCVLLSELNDRGIATACEVDAGNAVTMHALHLATGNVSTCLDWNNNYGDDPNKCILFHCGPVPQSMMTCKGQISAHAILDNAMDKPDCSWGCNTGRIAPTPVSFGSMLTEAGRLKFFLGEGEFTKDNIPADFFGCAGVLKTANLQQTLQTIGYAGYRHHVSVSPGVVTAAVQEAFEKYLGYDVDMV